MTIPPEIIRLIKIIPSILILLVIWSLAILGLTKILHKISSSEKIIITSFLIFGIVIGVWSFQMGKTDIVAALNFPGSTVSEIVFGDLSQYWKSISEPVGYEHISIRDLETGEIIGIQDEPQYDFPLKKVSDLYIPASILSWGLLGLVLQWVYNRWMKR